VEELGPWFHNLCLGGVLTAPDHFLGDYPTIKWKGFASVVPEDLSGMSVLDIGCNAGFYAMEMKRRGADLVVGIDSDERYLDQARFAAQVEDLEIHFEKLSVYEVGRLEQRFDLVIFMGVLYHLRHPLLALDLIHDNVAAGLLLFQTMQRGSNEVDPIQADYDFWSTEQFDGPGYPKMHFVEHRYSNDMTNWWIPNMACTQAMLRSSGFEIVEHPESEVYLCRRTELPEPPDGPRAVYPDTGGRRG
jgi:tRNA (mo5U34)-methyltransferase